VDVSIHARNRAKQPGRGYTPPKPDDPPEGGDFPPEFVFDKAKEARPAEFAAREKGGMAVVKFHASRRDMDLQCACFHQSGTDTMCANRVLWIALTLFLMSACGVDTATTAATAAKLKAEEAKAGRQQLERVEKKLEAVNQRNMDRLEKADDASSSSER
jgi:hypothetical protein